jgi:hypothetical protein
VKKKAGNLEKVSPGPASFLSSFDFKSSWYGYETWMKEYLFTGTVV